MAKRYDIGSLAPPVRLPNGTLRADARLTRVGVFTYRQPDGTFRKEFRPAKEVFKTDSLASFAMVPITDDHPPELLTAENATKFSVGSVGENVRQDGDFVAAPLVILDGEVIEKMDAGKVELSCGYEVDIIEESGEFEGERFDAIQTNIRGNHVAIVDMGRAGPDVRIRMDAATMVSEAPERADMEKELTDKLTATLEANAKLSADLASEKERADKAEAALAESKSRADALEGERDDAKAELEKVEKARQDAADNFSTQVKARVELEGQARRFLDKDADLSKMDDRALKLAVLKTDGLEIDDAKSDDYVSARFDAKLERSDAEQGSHADLRVATEAGRNDSTKARIDAARAAMVERNRNAWKQPKKEVN